MAEAAAALPAGDCGSGCVRHSRRPTANPWACASISRICFRQASQTGEADQVYQQLLADSQRPPGTPNYAQVLVGYANYLDNTKRSGPGREPPERLHGESPRSWRPWQESNLLYARAGAARAVTGNSDSRRRVRAHCPGQAAGCESNTTGKQVLLQTLLQKAKHCGPGAANSEEAFSLALDAMGGRTSGPVDREQIAWQVPGIASVLATKKASRQGGSNSTRISLASSRAWSVDKPCNRY